MLLSAITLSADGTNADTYVWLGEKAPVLLGALFSIVVVIWVIRAVRWLFSKDEGNDKQDGGNDA